MKFRHWLRFLLAAAFFPAGLTAAPAVDRVIERAARESYNFNSILDARVQVTVLDGIATLTGTAHDRDLRSLATDTLLGIPAVRAVNNRVIMETSISEYSDRWIALKLRNCLLMKTGIDATRISIDVSNQVARLTGAVVSAEQKQLAEKYARALNWVRSVSNELVVDNPPPAPAAAPASPPMDDASISALLKYCLRDERLITLSRTEITTSDGVVLISGPAESEAEKTQVSTCALSIRGVISVRNNMVSKSGDAANSPYALR